MFCRCFGNYLVGRHIITKKQLDLILEYRRHNRVKLGLIAVEQKLLTPARAEEVNRLQMRMDKRFGDIAIEKGYLSEKDVEKLLGLQGNPYLIFVQGAEDYNIMSKEKVDVCLLGFQKEFAYTSEQMEAFKGGDIEKTVEALTKAKEPYLSMISLILKNIIRFVSTDLSVGELTHVTEVTANYIALQELKGSYSAMLALTCMKDELLKIASPFAKEEFERVDADALDSVCEFINCTNGIFASKLSFEDVDLDMLPPQSYEGVTLQSEGGFHVLPVEVSGEWINLILNVKSEWCIKQS